MQDENSSQNVPECTHSEDKRLERLYDYTKFHIGIYLSAAGGIAALIGTKDAGWVIASLIGNQYLLYIAFALLVLAGMCGGMVATSITESSNFNNFWETKRHPTTIKIWEGKGEEWVGREHGFFWASLVFLAAAILVRYPGPPVHPPEPECKTPPNCCCICQQAPPALTAKP